MNVTTSLSVYRITVTNTSSAPRMGTVRIFMYSVNNDSQQPLMIEGTRKNAIEMDKFTVNCKYESDEISG